MAQPDYYLKTLGQPDDEPGKSTIIGVLKQIAGIGATPAPGERKPYLASLGRPEDEAGTPTMMGLVKKWRDDSGVPDVG